ncbi:MAG: hypothetical protein WD673_12205 [Alphaproteobacteria bacterium]
MSPFARIVISGLLGAALLAGTARADGFVSGIEDLPLMAGLTEVTDTGTVFDQPSGRFVEAYAVGAVTVEAVARFYQDTLPHLGWQADGPMSFAREGERLSIVMTTADGTLTVHFSLSPD